MRDRIIQAIIADRSRVLTLLTSFVLAVAGAVATRAFGVELNKEHEAQITLAFTLLFGWLIEGYAAEQNAKGAGKLQERLQAIDPSVVVDRHIGEKTIAAAEELVAQAAVNATATKRKE